MISEPEMVGDFGPPELSETVEPPAAERDSPRRPWLWALGGAVVASAVWAGGLYAFGGAAERLPDTRGYQVDEQLCEKAKLSTLTAELGKKIDSPLATVRKHAALDRANCTVPLLPAAADTEGFTIDHEIWIGVELHKKTDPAAEFEADLTPNEWYGAAGLKPEAVPGLGDQAFLVTEDDLSPPLLKVRDGGAVFTLQITVSVGFSGDAEPEGDYPEPDVSGLETLMIEDMRELMSTLKS
ncbi:hypothetical protein [Streptomyces sp. SYSU K21746]